MNQLILQNYIIFLLFFSFNNNVFAENPKEDGTGLYIFSCAGLKLSDHGMRMDREGYFYNQSTHKLICVLGMGAVSCTAPTKGKICTCPPPEWQANACWKKYAEFLKAKDLEYRKSRDEHIKKQKKFYENNSSRRAQ